MKTIKINEIEKIFKLIVEKLRFENNETIEIATDLYRYIPTESWESFNNDNIDTGSLYDDIENLQLLIDNPNRIITYVDFDRMSGVLRAISQKNNPI